MIATATTSAVVFPHLSPTIAIAWLKAVGLLKLSGASGYWHNDCFYLEIDSVENLVQDILHHYQPKPFVSPWNSYSLFNKAPGLDAVLSSTSERYALMREGYQELHQAMQSVDIQGQTSAQKKLTLMAELPSRIQNTYWQQWINAVGLVTETKKGAKFRCNDLLGTGGNVGTTDFCTVYYDVCSQLWDLETGEPAAETEAYIRASVLGEPVPQTLMLQGLLGHTYPAADYFDDLAPSGSSQADYLDNGGRSSQLANPIDLILYLEGSATFTGKAIPRNEVENEGEQEYTLAAYPLLLEVNSGSANTSDRTGRAYEVWLPLWDELMDWEEFQDMARDDLSFRLKHQIVDTVDMLDAMTQVDEYRGLSRYSRFGLWTRKGQGKYLIHVGLAVPGEKDFGAELRAWRLRARPENLPRESQAQYNLLTAIQKSLYRLQQGNSEATQVIRLLGQLEQLHSRIQPKSIPPVPKLSEQWVEAVHQELPNTLEVELAAALASTILANRDSNNGDSLRKLLTSARYNPKKKTWFWSNDHQPRLKTASLEALCLSLLRLWSEDANHHPSYGWTFWASPDAIATFIAGRTNDALILDLALGFSLCELPKTLDPFSQQQPLPEPYKYAASLQWSRETVLTMQTVNALLSGSTEPLCRQLSTAQRPAILPRAIATGKRSALALVFPCKPFYTFGDSHD